MGGCFHYGGDKADITPLFPTSSSSLSSSWISEEAVDVDRVVSGSPSGGDTDTSEIDAKEEMVVEL